MNENIDFIVAIPARFGSSRLPGKPLLPLNGEAMIVHVVRRALAAGARAVFVATDDERIAHALRDMPVHIVMTRNNHPSGSDRLAECAEQLAWANDAIVVNLQGDEPQAPVSGIRAVASALAHSTAPMATLATPVASVAELLNPNCVKVAVAANGHALYFSRAPIPWPRDAFAQSRETLPDAIAFLRHIGIYAYRAEFLRQFAQCEPTPLETAESLEQLRALEHGYAIQVALAPEPFPAGIDTPDDLRRVSLALSEQIG